MEVFRFIYYHYFMYEQLLLFAITFFTFMTLTLWSKIAIIFTTFLEWLEREILS